MQSRPPLRTPLKTVVTSGQTLYRRRKTAINSFGRSRRGKQETSAAFRRAAVKSRRHKPTQSTSNKHYCLRFEQVVSTPCRATAAQNCTATAARDQEAGIFIHTPRRFIRRGRTRATLPHAFFQPPWRDPGLSLGDWHPRQTLGGG